jgi:site-specific recombinase XerD
VISNRLLKGDYLIFSQPWKKDKALSRVQAWRIIARMAKLAGLERIGTHSMRKTFATELFNATGSFEAVQGALNHKYLSTTISYLLGKGKKLAIVDEE